MAVEWVRQNLSLMSNADFCVEVLRKMRAILIENPGDPSELRPTEVPRPEPGEDEVLVEVHAAAVNRSDVLNARGSLGLYSG